MIVFEDAGYQNLLPLTYWRPTAELRCGRGRVLDGILEWGGGELSGLWVRPQLSDVVQRRMKVPVNAGVRPGGLLVNGRWLPEGPTDDAPMPAVGMLEGQIAFVLCDETLAQRLNARTMLDPAAAEAALQDIERVPALGRMVHYPWDLLERGAQCLLTAWTAADAGGGGRIDERAHVLHPQHTHIGPGAHVQAGAVLDAENGPIFIADGARIMPNAVVEGPTYIGAHTQINAGAWIRTNVVIGPHCKIGGEVGMSMFQGYANKQHHGFVGHTCVGEWVNFGAGTTTSNLKNTYGTIRVPLGGLPVDSGRMFMGAVLGDFARTGINQALTTGSVVGLCSSVVTAGTAPQFVPSFRFLTDHKNEPYDRARGLDVAVKLMSRREVRMTAEERALFLQLPEMCLAHETV